jgi:heat shock protein HslJ
MTDLNGKAYVSQEISGASVISEPAIAVSFEGSNISLNAGCNTLFGEGMVEDGVLVMSTPLASTMMACDQPLMDRDQWLGTFIESQPAISVDGQTMTMVSGEESITFTESSL